MCEEKERMYGQPITLNNAAFHSRADTLRMAGSDVDYGKFHMIDAI